MTEKVIWPKMIGRRVKTPKGHVGELVAYTISWGEGESEFWHISGGFCTQAEPTLLPEREPREDEWVWHGGHGDSFEVGWVAQYDEQQAKDWELVRSLTDDEKIEICGGIPAMRKIVRRKLGLERDDD